MPLRNKNPNIVLLKIQIKIQPSIEFHQTELKLWHFDDLNLESQIKHHRYPTNPNRNIALNYSILDANQNLPKIWVQILFLIYLHLHMSVCLLVLWLKPL